MIGTDNQARSLGVCSGSATHHHFHSGTVDSFAVVRRDPRAHLYGEALT